MRAAVRHRLAGPRRRRAPHHHAAQPPGRSAATSATPRTCRTTRASSSGCTARRASNACTRAATSIAHAVRRLGELIARIRPSAVVAANPYAMLYASLALRQARLRAPLVVTFHTTLLAGAKAVAADALLPAALLERRLPGVRVRGAAPPLAAAAGRSAARNRVIHNGVDPEHWRSPGAGGARARMRRVLGLADADYVIGMCAVLRPEKNHLQLVEAIAQLRARGIPARALLIGDGPMRAGDRGARARARRRRRRADHRLPAGRAPAARRVRRGGAVQHLGGDVLARRARGDGARPAGGAVRDRRRRGDGAPRARTAFFSRSATPPRWSRASPRSPSRAARAAAWARRRATRWRRASPSARWSIATNGLLQQLVLTRSQRENLRRSAAAHQG